MYCMHLNEPVLHNINLKFTDGKACVIVAKTKEALVDYFANPVKPNERRSAVFNPTSIPHRAAGTPVETDFKRLAGFSVWCGDLLAAGNRIPITHVFWAEDGKIEEIPQNT